MLDTLSPGLLDQASRNQPYVTAYISAVHRDLPHWLADAFAATAEGLERARRRACAADERQRLTALKGTLRQQAGRWAQVLEQAIVQAVDQDLAGGAERPQPGCTRPSGEPVLSLMDDGTIDLDIALSRLGQVAELQAEAALRDLAARCSRLLGLQELDPDANPMRPAVLADALRRASATFGLDGPSRLLLLRELALAIGSRLAEVYAQQLDQLTRWGVEPSGFRRQALLPSDEADAGAGDPAPPDHHRPVRRRTGGSAGDVSAPYARTAHALTRLSAASQDRKGLPPAELMARLLARLLSRPWLSDGARTLVERLEAPVRRMAVTEPAVWHQPEHPLWQLLDRLVSAGAVFDGDHLGRTGAAAAALEQAVTRLEQTDPPEVRQLDLALAAVDDAASQLLGQQATRIAPQAEAMRAQLAREEIARRVHEQLVERARPSWVPAALRQFLVGPWATAMAHSAQEHGLDSARINEQDQAVDDMLDMCRRPRRQPLDAEAFTRCITHARLGLTDAGLPGARVDAELVDLGLVLRKPWPEGTAQPPGRHGEGEEASAWHPLDTAPAPLPDAPRDPPVAGTVDPGPDLEAGPSGMGLHEALPTVPIDLDGTAGDGAQVEADAWLGTLEPGMLCRLSVQGRWLNVQLVWRSLQRTMFVFSGRDGQDHSLTRAALHKLRGAGLAATIERGQFIAQALGELAAIATD